MMNVRKTSIFVLIIIIALAFVFTACDNENDNTGDTQDTQDTQDTPQQFDNIPAAQNETPDTDGSFNDITAAQLVADIKIGWNLGDTLDAHDHGEGWLSDTVLGMETAWGKPVTTKEMITAIKNAGFNAIRIPVTWYKAADSNYNIRADWMARVTEIVDYAVDNDMYIILNTHHDEHIFRLTNEQKNTSLNAFEKIWEQIADNFKNYNEKLIFEALNEPRTVGVPHEWTGGNAEEWANLNEYYQLFVNTIRESGGNNDKRILMVNTYGGYGGQNAIDGLVIPADTVSDKIIVSIHVYQPYHFAQNGAPVGTEYSVDTWSKSNSEDTSPITDPIYRAYNRFISNGIPVIIGEFGAQDKNNEAVRAQWAEFYIGYAKSRGVKCFLWDNGTFDINDGELMGFFDRNNNTFPFQDYLAGLMRGAEGEWEEENTTITKTVVFNENIYDAGDGQGEIAHGYQVRFPLSELLGSIQVADGDTYTLTYMVTSNVAIGNLQAVLVDTRQAVDHWKELSGYVDIGAVNIDSPVSGTKAITAAETAGDSSDSANQFVLVINESDIAASAPTLTFTALSLVKDNSFS
ncbi:MAG: glycoside hydrolase family 5 protein [Oscillospiraceae bacterium]|nr:glycoside hydrolase family 5 protein [Oscillospiraceae bacterium]